MRISRRLLTEGEEVVVATHPHWKGLVLPSLALPVIAGLTAYGVTAMPDNRLIGIERIAVVVVAVLLLVWFSLLPWLRWRTTSFVITDRRVIIRSGVLTRTGRDVPIGRVNDVTFRHGLVGRMLGCGSLVIESGGERGQLVLDDIPHVQEVQRRLSELVEEESNDRWEDEAPGVHRER